MKGIMKKEIILVKAPSILGLRPSGVQLLPEALEEAGLKKHLNICEARLVKPPPYNPHRDPQTKILNPYSLAEYSINLADAVQDILQAGKFPLVLGGDCSINIGIMLALKRLGRFGLFFLDGHADFYQPDASPTGEAADMDLALVSGRGPEIITDLEGQKPLVRDEDIVLFGQRDKEETIKYGSQQVSETSICVFELVKIRQNGLKKSIEDSLRHLNHLLGFWVHMDADVLSDDKMPAVDYRISGGISFKELAIIIRELLKSGRAKGMSLAIFNPLLDPSGKLASMIAKTVSAGFILNKS